MRSERGLGAGCDKNPEVMGQLSVTNRAPVRTDFGSCGLGMGCMGAGAMSRLWRARL